MEKDKSINLSWCVSTTSKKDPGISFQFLPLTGFLLHPCQIFEGFYDS